MSNASANGAAPAKPAPATRPDVNYREHNGKKYATSAAWGDVHTAAEHEEQIRVEAAAIWAEHGNPNLTRGLFMRLYPLLRRPIHPGHIIATSKADGKPYDSDGVRSVQVQIDRMHNVLTPMWWRVDHEHADSGTVCRVTVNVFDFQGNRLAEGQSAGGVKQASSQGNLLKGAFTNAAKLAFARVGPAHEVYTQAIDYDPDVNQDAANDQAAAPAGRAVEEDSEHARVRRLLDLFDISQSWNVELNRIRAMLTAAGCADTDDIDKAIAGLSPQQARVFDPMLTQAVQDAVAKGNGGVPS